MKKYILLILTIFLTGCSATYTIDLEEDGISDTIIITEKSKIVNNASQKQLENFNNNIIDWERAYEYYKRELFTKDDLTGYKYTSKFNYEEYDATAQITKCYESFKISKDHTIKIDTSDEFLCATYYKDVPSIKITIQSNYKVLSSNADERKGNKQTWIINRNNYENKPIHIELSTSEKNNFNKPPKERPNHKGFIFVIIFIILLIILRKLKKQNKKQTY